MEKIIRTCCQASHSECGVLVHVRDGKVVKIEGDPDHPMNRGYICPKGKNYHQFIYHPDRIKYPLKRTGLRGEGRWARISWSEALDTIAYKLNEIRKKDGPLAITTSLGTGPKGYEFMVFQLAYALGCNAMYATHMCYIPSRIAGMITIGADIAQERGPDYLNSKCILVWGGNPVISHPPRGRDILEAKKKGAKLIVVDPRKTVLASKADIWLQVRPAADDALALGILNVLINEKLYDKQFVENWCVGFDKLEKHIQSYTPEKVAEITWIPAEKIEAAARLYGTTKPAAAAVHHRVAVEHHTNSFQTLRAIYIIMTLGSSLDVAGGNLVSDFPKGFRGLWSLFNDPTLRPPGRDEPNRLGAKEFPMYSSPEAIYRPVSHNPTVIKAMLTGKPYPVKAMFAFNNVAVSSESTNDTWAALNNLEFSVVSDFFMTPTAELADIVLPSATWLEKDEISCISYENFICARQKVVDPLYECWDDKEMILELALRLGLKKWFPWNSVEEFNNWQLADMGLTFNDLKEKGYIFEPLRYRKYETKSFTTPSGKIELYSSTLEKYGYKPLPYYQENPESPISTPELLREFPLILITGARHIAFFHSEGRQIPNLRKLNPFPILELHPDTAKKLDISDGDWVWIETPRGKGRIKQMAKLTSDIDPRVCNAAHHWWFPEDPAPDHGIWKSNINVVTSIDPPYDPVVGAAPLRGLLCKVYKA